MVHSKSLASFASASTDCLFSSGTSHASPARAAPAGSIASKASIVKEFFMVPTPQLPSSMRAIMQRLANGLLKKDNYSCQLPVRKAGLQSIPTMGSARQVT